MASTTEQKIKNLLELGVEEIIEKESFVKKLESGKKLRVKLGADPTAPDLHLGHAVVLRKMREFQDLGHKAVFITGDYTAKIGDPSGKSKTRPPLSDEEIEKNAKTYFEQAGKIIDINNAEIRYNSEWFSKMKLEEFIKIASHFSMQRIMDREDFKKRILAGDEVAHHETLYQIMQAYDSVAVEADVELGGRDQRLNLLAGRELQKKMGAPEQDLVIMPILTGLDAKEKMSKSLGNYISLNDSPKEMFGKIMSIPDSLVLQYFELVVFSGKDEIEKIKERLHKENPRDIKLELAEKITGLYWSKKEGAEAKEEFIKVFSRKDMAESDIPGIKLDGPEELAEFLFSQGLAKSKTEARRLVLAGAVDIDGKTIKDPKFVVSPSSGQVLKVGKKKFVRVI